MGYFEAYRARLERNDKFLSELSIELNKKGFKTFCSDSNRLKSMIYVRTSDNEKETVVGFAEVPLRWYINNEHRENCCYYDLEDPFTVDEVITKLSFEKVDHRFDFYKKEIL